MNCLGMENEWWQEERKPWKYVEEENLVLKSSQESNLSILFAVQDLYLSESSIQPYLAELNADSVSASN